MHPMMRTFVSFVIMVSCCVGQCPMKGTPPPGHPTIPKVKRSFNYSQAFTAALAALDFAAVKQDIEQLLTSSQKFWPADFGNYGPLFIRLAWHCAGSYRSSDGRGGCDGGRIRFKPESSWADNRNLDKALELLRPLKAKYGEGLSWGDLIVLAGTSAIASMGGPSIGFCAGRVDDADGNESLWLGPSPEQKKEFPCAVGGKCTAEEGLGTTRVGLLYVNAEGPLGVPDPVGSAMEVRDTFRRMGMNDRETVALIGGGHTFGKAHGACTRQSGQQECGSGTGNNTWSSGFEGQWTTSPTAWDNAFFRELIDNDWEVHEGPGGVNRGWYQWRVKGQEGRGLMMLTSDMALKEDPDFRAIAEEFAADRATLDVEFAAAWYKLVTRDLGLHQRCVGPDVPSAPRWQPHLACGASLSEGGALAEAKAAVKAALSQVSGAGLGFSSSDEPGGDGAASGQLQAAEIRGGEADYGGWVVWLAWRCAYTYRQTDHKGGCNGGLIRHAPQKDWPVNLGTERVLAWLAPIKEQLGPATSWAQLITLAGVAALERAGSPPILFYGGVCDAAEADAAAWQEGLEGSEQQQGLREWMLLTALEEEEVVALQGRLRSAALGGLAGASAPLAAASLSSRYFQVSSPLQQDGTALPLTVCAQILANETWERVGEGNRTWYQAVGKDWAIEEEEFELLADGGFRRWVEVFAANDTRFKRTFSRAWSKLAHFNTLLTPAQWDTLNRWDGSDCEDEPLAAEETAGALGVRPATVVAAVVAGLLLKVLSR